MASLQIQPQTAVIGAEVRGVDLAKPLEAESVERLRAALLEHLVLFFRDQQLTAESHLAFAARFGEIDPAPFGRKHADFPAVTVLDQQSPRGEGADSWHTDNTFMAEPPMGSVLRAVRLPALGGDTCFASMYAAYDALSQPMRTFLDGLQARHDITRTLTKAIRDGHSDANLAEMQQRWPVVQHPVVRTHPETGRKCLFVNGNHTASIAGLEEEESRAILRFLVEHVRSPELQCRFRWEEGAVAFWDNRVVQHYAVPDYAERRVMHRVTLAGDRPY